MTQLEELRKKWENGLDEVTKVFDQNGQRCLVVLKENDTDDPYHCHRYFVLGFGDEAQWQVSVDGNRCHGETVMKWLCDPKAATCRS